MNAGTRWILAIVGLLGANLIAMGVLMGAARSGHSQVIPGYYDKAVHYDDAIDQAARNRALGWRVTPRWAGEFVADVVERNGTPVVGAIVTIEKRPRTPEQQHGIYDLTVTVTRGRDVFVEAMTAESP
jgi:nitrogen fixation protein FixH